MIYLDRIEWALIENIIVSRIRIGLANLGIRKITFLKSWVIDRNCAKLTKIVREELFRLLSSKLSSFWFI